MVVLGVQAHSQGNVSSSVTELHTVLMLDMCGRFACSPAQWGATIRALEQLYLCRVLKRLAVTHDQPTNPLWTVGIPVLCEVAAHLPTAALVICQFGMYVYLYCSHLLPQMGYTPVYSVHALSRAQCCCLL